MKKIILLCMFLSQIGYSQVTKAKKIIIVNIDKRSITNATPRIKINGVLTPRLVYRSFVVQKQELDSIEIIVPYRNLLLKKKEKSFHFPIKDKNNFFIYTYHGVIAIPIIKQVIGDDLIKLKTKKYVQKKIKEFNLEQ